MFSLRIVNVDHYMCAPKPGIDITYSQFRGSQVKLVPVIRIFGSSITGCKTCLHVHGVFPYVLVPFSGGDNPGKAMYLLASSLDKAINISLGSSNSSKQHVFKIVQVSGRPFYGYHSQEHQFLKIFFYNPLIIKRASDLLQNGAVCGTKFQLHESHVPFILQFFIDYNLYGMSFINLKSVIYRKNASPTGVVPGTISRESVSELEADAVAVDILNRLTVEGELAVNPGLAAIWKEEKERLNSNITESSQRPTQHIAMSEVFFKDKLLENLQFQGTCKSLLKEIIPYPAETQRTVDSEIVNASVLDTHAMTSLASMNITDENIPIVDEELVLNISQQFDSQNYLDQSLLVALDNLAERNIKPISQNIDDDSILGSQMASEVNCDLQDFSEHLKSPSKSSCNDLILFNSDGESEDSIDDKIPQIDGIGDILKAKKRKSERIAKRVLADSATFENSHPFENSDILLNNIKDSSCWPASGKDEGLDEIFSDDEPFNSPIHNFEENSSVHNDQVTIDSLNTFDTVLRGDPSFTCDENALNEDVFLQSKNESVTWNSLDVDDISDKKFDCSNLFNTTDVPLKSILNNSSPQSSKNEKIVQICKSKCSSSDSVPLPSNSLENIDTEKSISFASCSEDLFNTLQLDEMFDQDLNKGLEIIYENNSQRDNNNESKSLRNESNTTTYSNGEENIMAGNSKQISSNNNICVSDKDIITNISNEEPSNEFINDILVGDKIEQNKLWENELNYSDTLCTNTLPHTKNSLTNSIAHALKLDAVDIHNVPFVTSEITQIKDNLFNEIFEKSSLLLDNQSTAKTQPIDEKLESGNNEKTPTKNIHVEKDIQIYYVDSESSPNAKVSPKMKNQSHLLERNSPAKNKKLKAKKIEQRHLFCLKKLFVHYKTPTFTPIKYKMTKNEIERYFVQIEEIAEKLSRRDRSNSDEVIEWTPLRSLPECSIVKGTKKKNSKSTEKLKITNKAIYHGDVYKLKSCYVKLQKLTKKELKLCNNYKTTIRKNTEKHFKNSTTKKDEIKSKEEIHHRPKHDQKITCVNVNKLTKNNSKTSLISEQSLFIEHQQRDDNVKSNSNSIWEEDGFKSIPQKSDQHKNHKAVNKTKNNKSSNCLGGVKKVHYGISSKKNNVQEPSCKKDVIYSPSHSLTESSSNPNRLSKIPLKNHKTGSLDKGQTNKRRHNPNKINIVESVEKDLKLKKERETHLDILSEKSGDFKGISSDTNGSKCFVKNLNSKNNMKEIALKLGNYKLCNDNLKNKVKHKQRKRQEMIEKKNHSGNECFIKNSNATIVLDVNKEPNISIYSNEGHNIGLQSSKSDSSILKKSKDLLDVIKPSLIVSETNNNHEPVNSITFKPAILSVCIPKLKEQDLKGLNKKSHCNKKRSRSSHPHSLGKETPTISKDVSPCNDQQKDYNTNTSKSSSITKNKSFKNITKINKFKNSNVTKLNHSKLKQSNVCGKSKSIKCSSSENQPFLSNNNKSDMLNGATVTAFKNSNLFAKDNSSSSFNRSATFQKENMDNLGNFQMSVSHERNQEKELRVQMVKLSDHVMKEIKKSSLQERKPCIPRGSKINMDENFKRKRSLTEDNNGLLNDKRPSKIYSLDGTVDNSSSSDENVEGKSFNNVVASTSHSQTPTRRIRVSEQKRRTPKNNYVPLKIEIKKSPKQKLPHNKEKGSLLHSDLRNFKSSLCNLSEHSENDDERKRLDPFIKVQRISLPYKTDNFISKNIKIEQSTSSLNSDINCFEDQPVVKKLKVSIQRLSCDDKGEISEHKKPVVTPSSPLVHLSASLTTNSKKNSQVADILKNVPIGHPSTLQEEDGNFLSSSNKGNKVRKVLIFSDVDKGEDQKIIDNPIHDVSTRRCLRRKNSIDLFNVDSLPEGNNSTFILTNERSSDTFMNENRGQLPDSDQSDCTSSVNESVASHSLFNDLNPEDGLDKSLYHTKTSNIDLNSVKFHNSTLFTPVIQPPSRAQILMKIKELGLPEIVNEEPFYSNPHDMDKSYEIGNTTLKLKGKSVVHLEEYVGTFDGICRWKQNTGMLNNLCRNSDDSIMVTISPLKNPPSALDAKEWLNNKTCNLNNKIEALNKYTNKIVLTNSPHYLTDDDDDYNMTISQSTPLLKASFNEIEVKTAHGTPQDNSYKEYVMSPVMSSTPLLPKILLSKKQSSKGLLRSSNSSTLTTIKEDPDYKESPPLSQNSCCSQAGPVLGSQPLLSETAVKLSETKSPAYVSGQIDIATPNNSGNYRMEYENLQDIKTTHDHQYLTVMAMELHIHTRGELRPNPDHDSICCIFYSVDNDVPDTSITHVSGVIYVANDGKPMKMPQFHCEALAVIDEHALIVAFVELVKKWDPDIFVGYEIEMLSWGFLLQRAYLLNINLICELSRINVSSQTDDLDAKKDDVEIRFAGRIVLDLWRFLRHEVALQSYTFENIVYHVLHERIPTFSFHTLAMWWSNRYHQVQRWKVIEHYLTRVKGVIQLMKQLDLVGRTSEFARLFGIQFYEVLSRGSQFRVESMMLRLVKPLNYIAVSPSIQQRAKMRAPESLPLIMEPQSRFYSDPVIVLDFQSLYPSIIIAYNYCYSSCLGRVEHLGRSNLFEFGCTQLKVPIQELVQLEDKLNFSPCGVAFVNESVRQGVLPRMLSEILNTRLMVKQSMKQHKENKTLQRVLHNRQLGLKLIANVTYGYTSANFSGRMPCIEVGDSVVSKARETLERAITLVGNNSQWGARVIYGDTDSMFVLVPGKSRDEAFRIGAEIAEAVTNDNPKPIKLKLEKVYQPCLLQTKKRYVGYMYESPNQETPVYDAKGIETVRRDGCPAVAKILEKSLRILFGKKDISLIKQYVCQQFSKVMSGRISIQELTFAREYRGAGGYKPGACVPALELAKQWRKTDPRAEPRVGERVPYVIVAGPPGLPLIRLVRSPRHFLSDNSLKINSEYYILRVIIPPLERCFSLIGAQVSSWYADLPRKQYVHLPTSVPESSKRATISQYFVTTHCAVCQTVTTGGLCLDCQQRPQHVAVTLSNRVRAWERKQALVNKVCSSCCGRAYETDCISLDCPVLYRRYQASCDVNQADYIYSLQQQFTF